jgi:hypothetical protein
VLGGHVDVTSLLHNQHALQRKNEELRCPQRVFVQVCLFGRP